MPEQGTPIGELTLEDIQDVLCGEGTPDQRTRYRAAIDDPSSDLNVMLDGIRRDYRLNLFRPQATSEIPTEDAGTDSK